MSRSKAVRAEARRVPVRPLTYRVMCGIVVM